MGLVSIAAGIGSIIADAIVKEAADRIVAIVKQSTDRSDAYNKADEEKTALAEEMRDAESFEERSAILDKIYEARPKFN